MDIRRIAASFVYTLDAQEPIRNGFVEYDASDGRIVKVGECEPDEEVAQGKFGIISHSAVNIR